MITFRSTTCAATIALIAGCASAGFPSAGDPVSMIGSAERAIADAAASGADSLAPEPLRAARSYLESAKSDNEIGRTDRASLKAQQSVADATLAKEAALRAAAERRRADAEAALRAIPQGGDR